MADDRDKEESGERDNPFADVASFSTMPPPNDVHNASTALGPVPQALLEQLKQIAAAAPVRPDSPEPASARPSVKRPSQQPTPAAWLPPTDEELGGDGHIEGDGATSMEVDGVTTRATSSDAPREITPPPVTSPPPVIAVTTSEHRAAGGGSEPESVKSEKSPKSSKSGEPPTTGASGKSRENAKAKGDANARTRAAASSNANPSSTGRVVVLLLVLAALAFAAYRLVLPGLLHR